MSDDRPAPIRRPMFVKPSTLPKLSPERLKRQSLITRLACSLFDDHKHAIAFLNQANPSLGGRPLAIATESAEGYSAVEQTVRLIARPHSGRRQ